MTLGRVLKFALGILFDCEDHGKEDPQSFESATMKGIQMAGGIYWVVQVG